MERLGGVQKTLNHTGDTLMGSRWTLWVAAPEFKGQPRAQIGSADTLRRVQLMLLNQWHK